MFLHHTHLRSFFIFLSEQRNNPVISYNNRLICAERGLLEATSTGLDKTDGFYRHSEATFTLHDTQQYKDTNTWFTVTGALSDPKTKNKHAAATRNGFLTQELQKLHNFFSEIVTQKQSLRAFSWWLIWSSTQVGKHVGCAEKVTVLNKVFRWERREGVNAEKEIPNMDLNDSSCGDGNEGGFQVNGYRSKHLYFWGNNSSKVFSNKSN